MKLPEFPHHESVESLLKGLQTSERGLSGTEVKVRLGVFGKNELPEAAKRPAWLLFLRQCNNLMVYILLLAAAISYFTKHYVDVYVILVIVLINAIIGFVQEYKAAGALAALRKLLVPQCKVIRDGTLQTIDSVELVPGDVLALSEGDNIPADARIIFQKDARTSEAALTGEPIPVQKNDEQLAQQLPLGDRTNMVWKSTHLVSGSVRAVVTATGTRTQIGEIAKSLKDISPKKSNFQKKTDRLAKQMALVAIVSAMALFAVSYFLKGNALTDTLIISIAALVSVIPEGLPAALSVVMAIGSYRMSKKNAIIRQMTATETLGSVTTIVTDKTGTLTQNTMTIRKIWVPGIEDIEVAGEGWESIGDFRGEEKDLLALESLFEIAAHCHSAAVSEPETGTFEVTGDPTEAAFLVLGNKAGKDKSLEIIEDVAFSAALKFRSTLVKKGSESVRFYLGAPEAIIERCTRSLQHDERYLPCDDRERKSILSKIKSWSSESFRVIALARKSETEENVEHQGLDFVGLAGMMDPPRPGVLEAVQSCHRAGIRVIMATGDHASTAFSIGKQVGIVLPNREKAFSDQELAAMDEMDFDRAVREADVFSRLSPGMKLRIAKSLQKQGQLVAMTGDGVNDAPALKQADIGIAMGIMGTDVAKDASMMVLADDNFSTIVKAVEQGRIVFNNARRTSFFLASTNFAEISTLIVAILIGFPMPLTATQILWINLVTDGFCDKALAAEQGHGNELAAPPIPQSEKILNRSVLPFLIINVVLMTGLSLAAFHSYFPVSLEKARTMAFITLAFSQLFNVLNMRNLTGSSFKLGLFSNKWVNYALIVSVLIQIAIIETPLASFFAFQPVTLGDSLVWIGLSSSVFWVTELYKFIRFRRVS